MEIDDVASLRRDIYYVHLLLRDEPDGLIVVTGVGAFYTRYYYNFLCERIADRRVRLLPKSVSFK